MQAIALAFAATAAAPAPAASAASAPAQLAQCSTEMNNPSAVAVVVVARGTPQGVLRALRAGGVAVQRGSRRRGQPAFESGFERKTVTNCSPTE
jgi:hypothetical protein